MNFEASEAQRRYVMRGNDKLNVKRASGTRVMGCSVNSSRTTCARIYGSVAFFFLVGDYLRTIMLQKLTQQHDLVSPRRARFFCLLNGDDGGRRSGLQNVMVL